MRVKANNSNFQVFRGYKNVTCNEIQQYIIISHTIRQIHKAGEVWVLATLYFMEDKDGTFQANSSSFPSPNYGSEAKLAT